MKKESADDVAGRISIKLRETKRRIVEGWVPRRDFLSQEKRQAAVDWIRKQYKRVLLARRDNDEILFERAVISWEKAFEKLNSMCGEAYRARFPEPEDWPLRYFRWMNIKFMKLECELGTLYLVPRMPERKPAVEHWFTADEMLDILAHPTVVAAIKTFGLPSKKDLEKPKPGEKHMIINFTGDGRPVCYYDFPGAVKRG